MDKRRLTYADQLEYEIRHHSYTKRYGKGKYTLGNILDSVIDKGPRVLFKLKTILFIEDAEILSTILKTKGLNIEPYDFPRTFHVWQSSNRDGIPYKYLALKQLIKILAKQKGVNYKTFTGFKIIIKNLSAKIFFHTSINEWNTKLSGYLQCAYNASPAKAVLDLINNDDEFKDIRKKNLRAYDFPIAPNNMWKDKSGKPTDTAREATKCLIQTSAKQKGVNYRTFTGFKKLLEDFTQHTFHNIPINDWETTLSSMLLDVYRSSPSEAVLDLINHDDEFKNIRKKNLQPYDFPCASNNTWKDKNGSPTVAARRSMKQLVKTLAKKECVNYKTAKGFMKILENFTAKTFDEIPINDWGTVLSGIVGSVYNDSHREAILDLVMNDDDFKNFRKVMKKYVTLVENEPHGRGRMLSRAREVFQDAV